MPKGERRSRKEILQGQIQSKREKIEMWNGKIIKLQNEIDVLQTALDDIIASESRAIQEAQDKELLGILKKHNVSKEQLLDMLQND